MTDLSKTTHVTIKIIKDFPECCQDSNVVQLSRDHKPEIPQEKDRVVKCGGRVDKYTGNYLKYYLYRKR